MLEINFWTAKRGYIYLEDMVVLIHFGNAKRGNINLEDIVVLKESPKTIEEMLVIIFGTAKRGYI